MLQVDLKEAIAAIRKQKAKLVALQFPEGLKTRAQQIAREIEKATGAQTFGFIDPIFGACMLADENAKRLGANLLVHFGHSRFYTESMPTVYVPVFYEISEKQVQKTAEKISNELKKRKIKKIGLVGTIQYLNALPKIQAELKKRGIESKVGKGKNVSDGQVLGCNYSSPVSVIQNVQATVYVGDGRFHPIGIVLATNKPVFTIEPFEQTFKEIGNEKDRFVRQRMTLIGSLQDAKTFGILVSTEKGQWGIQKALLAKQKIEQHGKTAVILVGSLLKPDYVLGFKVDCLVNTACPRIATDDYNNYSAPVIAFAELPFVLGTKPLEQFDSKELV